MFFCLFALLLASVPLFIYGRWQLWYLRAKNSHMVFNWNPFSALRRMSKSDEAKGLDPTTTIYAILKNKKVKAMYGMFAGKPEYSFSNMDMLRDVIMEKYNSFDKSKFSNHLDRCVSRGLIFQTGQKWKRQRKILSAYFTYDALQSRIPAIKDVVKYFLDEYDTNYAQTGKAFPVMDSGIQISGEVVVTTFFGDNFKGKKIDGLSIAVALSELIKKMVYQLSEPKAIIRKLIFGQNAHKYKIASDIEIERNIDLFRQIGKEQIDARLNNPSLLEQSYDFISLYAKQYIEDQGDMTLDKELKITYEEILHQFFVFFIAGTDTTGHFIGTFLTYLALFPKYQDIIRNECQKVLGDRKLEDVNNNDLRQMQLLDAFMNELLRVKTPVLFLMPRKALEDVDVGGVKILKNSYIRCVTTQLMLDEDYYSNPNEFIPERWIDNRDELTRGLKNSIGLIIIAQNPYSFIPFSAGPRNCIGQHLAIIETKIAILNFLERFDIVLNEQVQVKWTLQFMRTLENQHTVYLRTRKQ